MKTLRTILPAVLFGVLFSGCVSAGHIALQRHIEGGIDVMTFDDAKARWGEPASRKMEDGLLKAEWIEEDYYRVESPFRKGFFEAPIVSGRKITLIFDGETGILVDYSIEYW